MSFQDAPQNLRPYLFHGVDISRTEGQAKGDCPFCTAAGKFSVQTATGQFRCVRCEETGNIYSFLHRLWQESLSRTEDKDLSALAKSRGVTVASLRYFGFAKSVLTQEWLVPSENIKGNLANLYRCVPLRQAKAPVGSPQKFQMLGTPGCKIQPFGTQHVIQRNNPILWIVEGVWDGCALFDLLNAHSEAADGSLIKASPGQPTLFDGQDIMPVPGATNFQGEWLPLLEGKEVRVCFDNDHPKKHPETGEELRVRDKPVRPGWDGMERLATLCSNSKKQPATLKLLYWNGDIEGHNPDLPDGFDIRDLVVARPKAPHLALRELHDRLRAIALKVPPKNGRPAKKQEEAPAIEPILRTSYEDLCKDYSSVLHFTQQLRDTLAVMLAVVLSTESEKVNHLWIRVIGPPGSGKSTLAEAISVAREWVSPKSIVTGFHSGFVDMTSDERETNSLIPHLDCKTIVLKDGDTLANSPNRDRILSELRDLYDGTSRAHYRTGQQDEFEDIRITFILCGTDELRSLNRTFLGERFLDCEIMKRGEDSKPFLQSAINNTYKSLVGGWKPKKDDEPLSNDRMHFLKQVTYGFLKHFKENLSSLPIPEFDQRASERVESMAQFVSFMRARVRREHGGDLNYRPRPELGTRLSSQFTKLAFFLAVVLGKQRIDDEVMRLVLKVVSDTCTGTPFEITSTLAREPGGTTAQQIAATINLPETTVRRVIGDMREFGIVESYAQPNNSDQRGRHRHMIRLTQMMMGLWRATFMPIPPKKPAPKRKAVKV